jgi:hypothetical protein
MHYRSYGRTDFWSKFQTLLEPPEFMNGYFLFLRVFLYFFF